MAMNRQAVLLIGSPRGPKSTSNALGTYLLERLQEKGVSVDKVFILQSLASEQGINSLIKTVAEADIIILASPLYADSHPSGVIAAMELIFERLKNKSRIGKQMMVAISNSGFPESRHNDLSLAISRRFALECGFEWVGGLALGGGESIGGRTLEEAGGLVRNVKRSLELTADALARGENISEDAVALMARPLVRRWLYLLIGNIGWRWKARKQGCREQLDRTPYRGRPL
ncbi:MAG TPA: NAD(P)H-dependent oxidoreductase [Thermodesulfovibrionales bacterium]|nr:NAD(P)H-dependent oxidoreductase [Thermodesulfovibrionales bacterium]